MVVMTEISRDFLIENGSKTQSSINHAEYTYKDRSYKVGWNSDVPGWVVYASYLLDCPDCHGEGYFPDSTQSFKFNRLCGLCYQEHWIVTR